MLGRNPKECKAVCSRVTFYNASIKNFYKYNVEIKTFAE
jgi:hypothetical protein